MYVFAVTMSQNFINMTTHTCTTSLVHEVCPVYTAAPEQATASY